MYKGKLKASLDAATRRKLTVLRMKSEQQQKISHVREQSCSLHAHISFEFARMHRVLSEREQRLSNELQDAEERILAQMQENLQRMQDTLDSVERFLRQLQTRMEQPDIVALIKEESIWNKRFADKHDTLDVVDLELPLGVFRGPLQYMAWREMVEAISPVPAPLTLNPDTANPWLQLSEDLCSVWMGAERQTLPESRWRFDRCAGVLAAQGFASGCHYWEVEVGAKTEWDLGVVRRSCQRKGRLERQPRDGYWRMSLRSGGGYQVVTEPPTRLALDRRPLSVGVYLDHEGGQVSFYDAGSMAHLYTFTHAFSETLYPYFCPCLTDGGKNAEPMKICRVTSHNLPVMLPAHSDTSSTITTTHHPHPS
ncbi:zinc-binding protein A33-like [Rhinoraja longicauda]